MATAQARLSGRFPPGTRVRLIQVRDESVLRAEGGTELDTATVDESGEVKFTKGVKDGGRYFIVGNVGGFPLEVRVRGNADGSDAVLAQAPVQADRAKLSDGTFVDEVPEQAGKDDLPRFEAAPDLAQRQVGDKVVQRSATARGTAHPVDPDEPAPYPSQEADEYSEGKRLQMSDTPLGRATPIVDAPQRQEDARGLWQRSATPTGVATPLPGGGPVQAQKDKESSFAKAARGEANQAAASPLDVPGKAKGKAAKDEPSDGPEQVRSVSGDTVETVTGLDPQGQPVSDEVATAAGVEAASAPAEPVKKSRSSKSTSSTTKRSK